MKEIAILSVLFVFGIKVFAFSSLDRDAIKPLDYRWHDSSKEISLVSYNVENLFDTQHAAGKNDFEFLPKKLANGKTNQVKIDGCRKMTNDYYRKRCFAIDWTQEGLNLKIAQIKQVLNLQGDKPDILALQEVENRAVVENLAQSLGYEKQNIRISESLDARGIEVAILFSSKKLQLLSSGEEQVKLGKETLRTRPIFWSIFQVKNTEEKLAVYSLHWPSQGSSTKARLAAAKALSLSIKKLKSMHQDLHIVAMGDFNTTKYDRPHPIINHLDRGANALHDTLTLLKENDDKSFYRMALGTYFYIRAGAWSYFDKILVSTSLTSGDGNLELDKKSFRILAIEEITTKHLERFDNNHNFANLTHGIPWEYDHSSLTPSSAGYSDHFPVRAILKIK